MKTQPNLIYKVLTVIVLAASLFLTYSGTAQTTNANEFWISTNSATGRLGIGTITDPFDGSTEAKFDAAMNNMPANSMIHIMAGTYQTLGNEMGYWCVKTGQKILGSGVDVTIIKLDSTFGGQHTAIIGTSGQNALTNVEVCDLTCDCNYSVGENASLSGIDIDGTQNTVRRVKVIHVAAYAPTYWEPYGIILSAYLLPVATGNIIEDCEVSQFAGGQWNMNGIAIVNASGSTQNKGGIIRNCRVLGGGATTNNIIYGIAAVSDCLIEGNYIEGAERGSYWESGVTNLMFVHNTFKNCGTPVIMFEFSGGCCKDLTFAFNQMEVTNFALNGTMINAFIFGFGYFTNVSIIGNKVTCIGSVGTGIQPCFINAANVTGLNVAYNTVDSRLINSFLNCVNVNIDNNYDLLGNYLYGMNVPTLGGMPVYPFGLNLVGSAGQSPALTALGLPSNPNAVVTNGSTQPITFNTNLTVSGNVSIGTSSQSQNLSVSGNATISGSLAVSGSAIQGLWVNSPGGCPGQFVSTNFVSCIQFGNPDQSHLMYFGIRKDLGYDSFQFYNYNGDKTVPMMVINANNNGGNGNVGIGTGTNNPAQRLTVSGNASISGTNFASQFVGGGSGLTGITALQAGAVSATNATIWSSLAVTNTAVTNWAALNVTPSNAVMSVNGIYVAILQTNGVLNAVNGLSTTVSNKLGAVSITNSASPFHWTNTTPRNVTVYINNLKGSVGYNDSLIYGPTTNGCATVMLQPNEYFSFTNTTGTIITTFKWHPF